MGTLIKTPLKYCVQSLMSKVLSNEFLKLRCSSITLEITHPTGQDNILDDDEPMNMTISYDYFCLLQGRNVREPGSHLRCVLATD